MAASQTTILLKAGACDGSLSASLSPQGPQVCAFKVPETLCICTNDTVLTAPLQKQAPEVPPCPAEDGVISRLYHQM